MNIKQTFLLPFLLLAAVANAQSSLSAVEAKSHIGQKASICGEVASTHYAERTVQIELTQVSTFARQE